MKKTEFRAVTIKMQHLIKDCGKNGITWLLNFHPTRSFSCLRSFSGFTLFELIVVMIIIGLMSALVAPRMVGPLENLKLKTSANHLSAMLRFARNHAVTEKKEFVAFFDFNNNRVVLLSDCPVNDTDESCAEGEVYKLPDGVLLESLQVNDAKQDENKGEITFFPNGGNSGGTVTLKNSDGDLKKISVDFITGIVKIIGE